MTAPRPPAGLATRGRKLWRELNAGRTWDAAGRVLLAEACRCADRLEKLDALLREDVSAWAEIVDDYAKNAGHRTTELVIDDALSEARQQASALLTTLTKLGLGKSEAVKAPTGSLVDEIAKRRAERVKAAS